MWRKIIAPSEVCIAHGTKLFCQIDRGRSSRTGSVRDEQGVIRWRYTFQRGAGGRSSVNPLNKPDFVMAAPNGEQRATIGRASFIPPVFDILENDAKIGRIQLTSALRNKYSISIDGVDSWTFRMPLYTIRFYGESSSSTDIWVVVGPSKKEWSILIRADVNEWPLVAALAFIHNEWWHYA